jgi:hypothetical protein
MTAHTPASTRRGRLQFLLLAAIFLGPVGLSFWMYFGGHLIPAHRVNHGVLFEPTRAVPTGALPLLAGGVTDERWLRGHWSLVYRVDAHCDDACRVDLAEIRLVRLAMDHERDRVRRVVLVRTAGADAAQFGPPDPSLAVVRLEGPTGAAVAAAFDGPGAGEAGARDVYVVDPLGNLVMRFPSGSDRKGLIKDLDKLLRLSHIG